MAEKTVVQASNFVRNIIAKDVRKGNNDGQVVTRFPPEPNGYLHVGHATSICLNFGMAQDFDGQCNLRFDDTNPEKESDEYIQSIKRDIEWLGFEWGNKECYASNYFDQLHTFAVELINKGLAYVCDLSPDQAREYRGNLTEPGKNSPFRERSIADSLDLFARMRAGEFGDGERVLRAKIDMASPNMNLRDPIIYRIRHIEHHQTGNAWCIYPMYDFTHGLSDALERVTHSICTLEFEDHRPLYDWFIDNVTLPSGKRRPRQYEFARLELNYTITSKRKLKQLVDNNTVTAWDDPRMPTISGMRRRGYTPASLRNFCAATPVARSKGITDFSRLESSVRDDLDASASRAMCVLRPLKVTISNWPAGHTEQLAVPKHPKDEAMGERQLVMSKEVFIDQHDFAEQPEGKWKRLAPEQSVRLRGGYVITCEQVIKDATDDVVELVCRYDENTLGTKPEGYKPNGVVHWVSAEAHQVVNVRLYDRLFNHANPDGDKEVDFMTHVNPNNLLLIEGALAEPSLASAQDGDRFQFEREGYFCVDKDSTSQRLVFNRTVTLRDSWAKKG
ncbi:MAG: glutamine--tRNA ligase/YqeY domain fusion protein [Oceanospirillaceae bacterium]|nr:glutamine--tRNA ligase/YqeY domain fusion protein [Oceanospirillaceae bacterium]MBT6077102.1 glutamine--tRNA ligase/YqeY domain fusion protein [Oceanospirillaceae bacterium]